MTSLESWYRRERFWAKITSWASRNLHETQKRRQQAQREHYLRNRALNNPTTARQSVMTEEDEDEFFG